ncbi:MAG: hypothetical protein WCK02_05735 [Bacteroidota bacterium]
MTTIQSKKLTINQIDVKLYEFLKNFNNFEKLMPPQITNWSSDTSTCNFTIEGMADVSLELGNCIPNSKIIYVSAGKTPFNFDLVTNITTLPDNKTECQIVMNADLNPFLKIMAERPLNNFVNTLIEKLKEVSEK